MVRVLFWAARTPADKHRRRTRHAPPHGRSTFTAPPSSRFPQTLFSIPLVAVPRSARPHHFPAAALHQPVARRHPGCRDRDSPSHHRRHHRPHQPAHTSPMLRMPGPSVVYRSQQRSRLAAPAATSSANPAGWPQWPHAHYRLIAALALLWPEPTLLTPAPSKSPPSTSDRETHSSLVSPEGHTMLIDAGGPVGRTGSIATTTPPASISAKTSSHPTCGRAASAISTSSSSPTPTATTWAACPPSFVTSAPASSGLASTLTLPTTLRC